MNTYTRHDLPITFCLCVNYLYSLTTWYRKDVAYVTLHTSILFCLTYLSLSYDNLLTSYYTVVHYCIICFLNLAVTYCFYSYGSCLVTNFIYHSIYGTANVIRVPPPNSETTANMR